MSCIPEIKVRTLWTVRHKNLKIAQYILSSIFQLNFSFISSKLKSHWSSVYHLPKWNLLWHLGRRLKIRNNTVIIYQEINFFLLVLCCWLSTNYNNSNDWHTRYEFISCGHTEPMAWADFTAAIRWNQTHLKLASLSACVHGI